MHPHSSNRKSKIENRQSLSGIFLLHFPSARAALALPSTVSCAVRTFLIQVKQPERDRRDCRNHHHCSVERAFRVRLKQEIRSTKCKTSRHGHFSGHVVMANRIHTLYQRAAGEAANIDFNDCTHGALRHLGKTGHIDHMEAIGGLTR